MGGVQLIETTCSTRLAVLFVESLLFSLFFVYWAILYLIQNVCVLEDFIQNLIISFQELQARRSGAAAIVRLQTREQES